MRILAIFLCLLQALTAILNVEVSGTLSSNDIGFTGNWIEIPSKRQGLSSFVKHLGLNAVYVFAILTKQWQTKETITQNGEIITISGTRGPREEEFMDRVVVDNTTRTNIKYPSGEIAEAVASVKKYSNKERLTIRTFTTGKNEPRSITFRTWTKATDEMTTIILPFDKEGKAKRDNLLVMYFQRDDKK